MTLSLPIYFVALASALITALVAVPVWSRWCNRKGLVDEPGERKLHPHPIPLAGGLALATAITLPLIIAAFFIYARGSPEAASQALHSTGPHGLFDPVTIGLLHHGLTRRDLQLLGIVLGAIGMLLVGLWDDKHELKPGAKFAAQMVISAMVAASGVRITLFVPSILFSYAVTILWLLTIINAFNFIDNMNGLCAGVGAVASGYFGLIAASQDQYLVGLMAFLILGALLGFLPYNFPRALAFLGDSGSHVVGYLLGILAILPHFYTSGHPRPWAVLVPLFILSVPLVDLAWVVIKRWRMGKPFYQGDRNHLSHQLVQAGFSEPRAVILIWLAALVAGGLACLFG